MEKIKEWFWRLRDGLGRTLIYLTNMRVCKVCGVVAARGGIDGLCEDGTFVYYCERCHNAGLIAEDLKRVRQEFGLLE